jgi:ubiquinol oxidase
MSVYYTICFMLDVIYDKKPIDRFWFLETVARMPYFSYIATLHMYETLGFWEIDGELKRVHLDEEINESSHLRIMESLGGNTLWWNRFLARHGAMAYYVVLMVLYLFSPRIAYLSSELLEMHAVDTYTEFYESNKDILSSMPLTPAAYMYSPEAKNMYDVFVRIADDEFYHAETMKTIRNYES